MQELKEKWGAGSQNWDVNKKQSSSAKPTSLSSRPQSEYFEAFEPNAHANSLKLIKRDGRIVFMPYSQQPIIIYDPSSGISIKSISLHITITGRGLTPLAEWLSAMRVKWIKECATGIDDQKEELFVMDIEYEELG